MGPPGPTTLPIITQFATLALSVSKSLKSLAWYHWLLGGVTALAPTLLLTGWYGGQALQSEPSLPLLPCQFP